MPILYNGRDCLLEIEVLNMIIIMIMLTLLNYMLGRQYTIVSVQTLNKKLIQVTVTVID